MECRHWIISCFTDKSRYYLCECTSTLPPRPLPDLACSQSDDSEAVASSSTGNVVTGPASAPHLTGPPWAYPRPGLSKLDEGPPFSSVILLYLGLPTLGGGCPLLDHFLLEVRCQEHSQVSLPYTMAPRAKLSQGGGDQTSSAVDVRHQWMNHRDPVPEPGVQSSSRPPTCGFPPRLGGGGAGRWWGRWWGRGNGHPRSATNLLIRRW